MARMVVSGGVCIWRESLSLESGGWFCVWFWQESGFCAREDVFRI
jgi:hypothetical protein